MFSAKIVSTPSLYHRPQETDRTVYVSNDQSVLSIDKVREYI